ncbi:unnamed protein product [Urochloa humidicola]
MAGGQEARHGRRPRRRGGRFQAIHLASSPSLVQARLGGPCRRWGRGSPSERRDGLAGDARPSGDRRARWPAAAVEGSIGGVPPCVWLAYASATGLGRAWLFPAPSSTSGHPQLPLRWRNSTAAQIGDLDAVAARLATPPHGTLSMWYHRAWRIGTSRC